VLTTPYSYNIDLNDLNTSHSLAVLSVRAGSRVLDIGAADGSVAKILKQRGCQVWAVEMDENAARAAALVCEHVVVGDVESMDLDDAFGGMRFDAVLLLDVLEHLREPLSALKRSAKLLEPDGQIVASIPNVTHGAVRLSLLRGTFRYTETGLLDRTHLRFFDRDAVEQLFAEAGLEVADRLRVTRGLTETEIPIDLAGFPPSVISDVERDPESATFQFVMVAKTRSGIGSWHQSESLAARLQEQVHQLERQFRECEGYAKSLERRIQEHDQTSRQASRDIADLALRLDEAKAALEERGDALSGRMEELHHRDRELRYAQSSLAIQEAFISELRQKMLDRDREAADLAGQAQNAQMYALDRDREAADLAQQVQNAQMCALDRDREAAALIEEAQSARVRAASELATVQARQLYTAEELTRAQTALSAPSIRTVTRFSAWLRTHPRLRNSLRWCFGSMFLPS